MYRVGSRGLEVLLAHPGGPYFRKKDLGAWTLPKGLLEANESKLAAASREFLEETGLDQTVLPRDQNGFIELGSVRMSSGKQVHAWGFEGDCDPETLESNTFEIEWPPRSKRRELFPEIDRFSFFDLKQAFERLRPAQCPFLERLARVLSGRQRQNGSVEESD